MLTVAQLFNILFTFYGPKMLISVFSEAFHWTLSQARSIQSTPSHPISLTSSLTAPRVAQITLSFSTHFSCPSHEIHDTRIFRRARFVTRIFPVFVFPGQVIICWLQVKCLRKVERGKGREWTKIFDPVSGWGG